MTAVVVGAQVTQPHDPALRPEFARRILKIPGVTGLEIAFGSATWRDHDEAWLPQVLPEGSQNTVSLMGITMERASDGIGLASVDQDRRREAVQISRETRDFVSKLADRGAETVSVLVQSAPTIDPSRVHNATWALARSLDELAGWDWCGASIVIEHCDARRAGETYFKGYLPLEEEIGVVDALEGSSVGVAINWGRSVIEGQDVRTPVEHANFATASGVLHGVMISGVSDQGGLYGAAWDDSHPPARPSLDWPQGEPSSLLGLDEVPVFLSSTDLASLRFVGVKVALRDPHAEVEDRVSVNAAIADALNRGSTTSRAHAGIYGKATNGRGGK